MKVLQINCVYNTGSTGKIMYDIHRGLLSKGIESVICYGRGEKTSDKYVYKTCGELYSKINNLATRFTGLMYGHCMLSTAKLISVIKKEKPDVVHLHCINGYFVNIYRIVDWLKKNNIRTILTLHAEFMYTANCGHAFDCEKWKSGCGKCPRFKAETKSLVFDKTSVSWKKMKKAFDGFGDNLTVVSVSPWLMGRAKESPILRNFKHTVVLNGLDNNVFKYYDREALKKEYGFENEKIIFHATPSFSDNPEHIKGGYYIIELAKRIKNVKFIVAGNYDKSMNVSDNIIMLGRISDQAELAKYYAMADVTLIASKKETFSMIVAESLCCGTPVAGFEAGAPEQITIPQYSSFVKYGDTDALEESVLKWLAEEKESENIALLATEKYSRQKMFRQYLNIYEKREN